MQWTGYSCKKNIRNILEFTTPLNINLWQTIYYYLFYNNWQIIISNRHMYSVSLSAIWHLYPYRGNHLPCHLVVCSISYHSLHFTTFTTLFSLSHACDKLNTVTYYSMTELNIYTIFTLNFFTSHDAFDMILAVCRTRVTYEPSTLYMTAHHMRYSVALSYLVRASDRCSNPVGTHIFFFLPRSWQTQYSYLLQYDQA